MSSKAAGRLAGKRITTDDVANPKSKTRKQTYKDVRLVGDKETGILALMNHGLVYYPYSLDGRKVKLAWSSVDKHFVSSDSPEVLTILYKCGKKVNFEINDTLTRIRVLGDITSRMREAEEEDVAEKKRSAQYHRPITLADGNDSFTSVGDRDDDEYDYLESGIPFFVSPMASRNKLSISALISPEPERRKLTTGGRHSLHDTPSQLTPTSKRSSKRGRHSSHIPPTAPLTPTVTKKLSTSRGEPTPPRKKSALSQSLSNARRRHSTENLASLACERQSTSEHAFIANPTVSRNSRVLSHSSSLPVDSGKSSRRRHSLGSATPQTPTSSKASKRLSTAAFGQGDDWTKSPVPVTPPSTRKSATNPGKRLSSQGSNKSEEIITVKNPSSLVSPLSAPKSSSRSKSLHNPRLVPNSPSVTPSSERNKIKASRRLSLQNDLQSKGPSLREQTRRRLASQDPPAFASPTKSSRKSLSPKRKRSPKKSRMDDDKSDRSNVLGGLPSIPMLDESDHSFGEDSLMAASLRDAPKSLHKLDEDNSFHSSGEIIKALMEDFSSRDYEDSQDLEDSFFCDDGEDVYLKDPSPNNSIHSSTHSNPKISRLSASSSAHSSNNSNHSKESKVTRLTGSLHNTPREQEAKPTRLSSSVHSTRSNKDPKSVRRGQALQWDLQTVSTERSDGNSDRVVNEEKELLVLHKSEKRRTCSWYCLLGMLVCALLGPIIFGATVLANEFKSSYQAQSLRGSAAPSLSPTSASPTLSPTESPTVFSNRGELDGLAPLEDSNRAELDGLVPLDNYGSNNSSSPPIPPTGSAAPAKVTRKPKNYIEFGSISNFEQSSDCTGFSTKSFVLSSSFNFTFADVYQDSAFPDNFWTGHEEEISLLSFVFLREELERIFPDTFVGMAGERHTGLHYSNSFCHACEKYEHLYRLEFEAGLRFSSCIDAHQILRNLPYSLNYKVLLSTVNGILPQEDADQPRSRYPFGDVKAFDGHEKCASTCGKSKKKVLRRVV